MRVMSPVARYAQLRRQLQASLFCARTLKTYSESAKWETVVIMYETLFLPHPPTVFSFESLSSGPFVARSPEVPCRLCDAGHVAPCNREPNKDSFEPHNASGKAPQDSEFAKHLCAIDRVALVLENGTMPPFPKSPSTKLF